MSNKTLLHSGHESTGRLLSSVVEVVNALNHYSSIARFKQLVLMSKLTRPSAAVTGGLMSSGIASIERTASCSGRVTIGASHVMSERRRSRQRRMRLIECPTVTNKFSKRSSTSSYYVVRPTILSECCSGRCWGSAIATAGETTRARRSSLGASLGTLTIKLSSTKSTSSHRHRCNDGTSKLRSRLIS